ncbi:hypothetical protein GPX89_04455 [Nocardia sp. ET3-3]|uniref:Uncharacterized protein n=1 Tax=Nocardia terrae TaxID=2675851 RepID=A0A7K1UQ66_9NOCA|nr:hypothetical protein [Nocardia terrae]MVU76493.1 hypothetical protein [Nocardia terrae]
MAVAFEYRVGDIIDVSCPFTETRVDEVTDDEIFVDSPWQDGVVMALALEPDPEHELFRIRPEPRTLTADAMCRIGIPPTMLRVTEEQRLPFDPEDGIPRTLEVRFRPYAFLEPGDQVADARARVWRFESAWEWEPFDGATGAEPAWPLMLLTRHGDSDDDAAAVDVAEATRTGSHHEELARWAALAGLDEPAE